MSGGAASREWEATLAAAGFAPHAGGPAAAFRRAVRAPWCIEARAHADGHLDLGLTLSASAAGALVGPVHRVLRPAALAEALPHVVEALEALAAAAEALRCPDCHALGVLAEDEGGPYLACGQPRRGRRPFDASTRRCRRSLVMSALIVYGDPEHGGGA